MECLRHVDMESHYCRCPDPVSDCVSHLVTGVESLRHVVSRLADKCLLLQMDLSLVPPTTMLLTQSANLGNSYKYLIHLQSLLTVAILAINLLDQERECVFQYHSGRDFLHIVNVGLDLNNRDHIFHGYF